jgi:tetratricopeptide (TPR) repeat protein/DNA-binding beta-propeller fold protein YncE
MVSLSLCRLIGITVFSSVLLVNNAAAQQITQFLQQETLGDVLEEATGLKILDNGKILLTSSDDGTLVVIDGQDVQTVRLTGKVFEDDDVTGVDMLPNGVLVFANAGDQLVAKIAADGQLVHHFARQGDNPGRLDDPVAIAASPNQRIYVAEKGNQRVSVFNDQGLFLRHLGNSGDGRSDLRNPTQIALDAEENLYVLEPGENFRITIFDHHGAMLERLDADSLAEVMGYRLDVSAMTADANGTIFLGDTNTRQIISYDWQHRKTQYRFGSLGQSQGQYRQISLLAVNNRAQLAVVDKVNEKLEVYQLDTTDYASAKRLDTFRFNLVIEQSCLMTQPLSDDKLLCARDSNIVILDLEGKELGVFAAGIDDPLAMHASSHLVAVLEHNKLHAYRPDGKKLYSLGRYGIAPGAFDGSRYVYTAHDRVYVGDTGNNRIQIFAADGQFIEEIQGWKETFWKVGPLAVDSQQNIYVADQESKGLIRKIDPNSRRRVADIGDEVGDKHRPKAVHALDFDAQDRLYALVGTAHNPYSVRVYAQTRQLAEFGAAGDYAGSVYFDEPRSLAVNSGAKNSVIINDPEQSRIFLFDYHEIPDPAFGLKVTGDRQRVNLSWDSTRSPLIEHFRIEAAAAQEDPFETIDTTQDLARGYELEQIGARQWFRIIAVSGLGLDSKPSAAQQNRFFPLLKLHEQGQFTDVITMADKLRKNDPDNGDILQLKADSEFATGQWLAAMTSYRELAALEAYARAATKQMVQIHFELEQFLEARELIEPVLAGQPQDPYPYEICAQISLKLNDAISAVTCAEDGLAVAPNHLSLRYLLGKAYIAAGVNDQGILEFEQLLASADLPPLLALSVADDLMQIDQFERALEQYQVLTEAPANLTQARIGQAHALLSLQRDDEARAIAVKLSASTDSRGEGYYLLGKIAAKQGKHSEAVLRLSRACKLKPQNIDAWVSLALAYIELDKTADAVKTLAQGIDSNPEAFTLYRQAGELELQQENHAEAKRYLEQAVNLNPASYPSIILYARSLFATRDYRLAARYAEKAAKLAPKDTGVLTLQADIANQQGKLGDAIEFLKTAIALQPASADLQLRLGRVYLHANLFDASHLHLERATAINPAWSDPLVTLAQLYSKRRQFDQAIKVLEQAVQLDPSDNNRALLNSAFADKKKSLDFEHNAPQLTLSNLNLKQVFSAAYKQYADTPIGSVTLKNVGATDYGNLQLSFQIKEYMDFPVLQEIPLIKGNETQHHDLKVTFNNKILDVDEDIGVQVEVKLTFQHDGRKDDIRLTQPMTIYGKNAMVWGQANMVGSFVTPKDDTLRDFVRGIINKYQPEVGPLNEKMVSAMTYFSALGALGTRYIVDPNTPYTSLRDDQVDYVQFPRETLKLRSGDCDDLSVLMSAGLENLGIETVLLEMPGHLMMMFNTGLPESEASLISQDHSLLAIHNGQVWIPVESTMVNASFNEAWAEGARKYQDAFKQQQLGIIDLKKAWQQYRPVTLQKADYSIEMPDDNQMQALVGKAQNQLLSRSISRLILPYQALIRNNPGNIDARLQIAILYSRYGLADEAQEVFDALHEIAPGNSALHNNQGNLHLLQKRTQQAIESYRKAAELDPDDAGILVNLSMAHYQKGDISGATGYLDQAISRNASMANQYSAYQKLLNQ